MLRHSHALLWLSVIVFITLILAFLLPVTPHDYWWYLRIAQDTLLTGSIPQNNHLSFAQAGRPVLYHSWGAAILLWLAYHWGGLSLSVLLRGLLLAITYGLIWTMARRLKGGEISTTLIVLVAILTSSNNWAIRPQLFAYPLFALALFLLYEWHVKGRKLPLLFLPLCSLIWVNMHGSFVLLPLLLGPALVFGRGPRKSLILSLGGVLLATLINPHGLQAWTYVYHSLTLPSNRFSAEWHPPINNHWQAHLFFLWLLITPWLNALSPRKPDRLEWTWWIGFGTLALWGVRYIIWFVFIMTILTARTITPWEQRLYRVRQSRFDSRIHPIVNVLLASFLLALSFLFLPGLREQWWQNAPPVMKHTPVAATQWLADHADLEGPLWAEIGFASYLEFALPGRPPWMDTRFEVFTVEQWEAYRAISQAEYDWQDHLDQIQVNLLMISIQAQPRLWQALTTSPAWCLRYRDDLAAVYQRCSTPSHESGKK